MVIKSVNPYQKYNNESNSQHKVETAFIRCKCESLSKIQKRKQFTTYSLHYQVPHIV